MIAQVLRPTLLLLSASCAVVQPDEFSLGYEHAFANYTSDAWGDDTVNAGEDVISVAFTWYVGTTMPPKRAAVLDPGLYQEEEPPVPHPVPTPKQLPAVAASGPEPREPSGSDSVSLYQVTTLLGSAYVAWVNRHRMVPGGSKEGQA